MLMRKNKVGNKYIDDDDENSIESSESESEDEIDIHEIVKTGTLAEVKEAIAKDRPRLIALKDEVSILECFGGVEIYILEIFICQYFVM
jgi:hypothetical protein